MSSLPNSGQIAFTAINNTLGRATRNQLALSDAAVRSLSGVPSGQIGFSNFYGKSSGLYAFTAHTFTNATASGLNGPTLAQCRTAYSTTSWASTYLNMTTQGIQEWTVPITGNYAFTVAGARGGNVWSVVGGLGNVIVQSNVSLTQGEVLRLVVGQHGGSSTINQYGSNLAAGGGGGSFVYKGVIARNNCILAAGGGGGARWNSGAASINGSSSTSGTAGGNSGSYTGGAGGTNGSGGSGGGGAGVGNAGTNIAGGTGGSDQGTGGPGGGGGMGVGDTGATFLGATAPAGVGMPGGFGGGGGSSVAEYGGRGGGGGYSGGGGGAGKTQGVGGGGGSYSFYTSGYTSNAGTNNGHGYITITKQ